MSPINRRDFLKGGTMAVAAAGVVAAAPMALPTLAGAAGPGSPAADGAETAGRPNQPNQPNQPIVAHVRNLRTGEIELFSGEQEFVVHDPQLARKLYDVSR